MEGESNTLINNIRKSIVKFLATAVFLLLFFGIGSTAHAASLYFSPSSGSHGVGGTFSTSVFVSSSDQAMNAVSGVVSFPKDKLEVTSVSRSGSVIDLWVEEPIFSNSGGTVSFEGIALNPGYIGSSGRVVTINFRVVSSGNASLAFSSGSILANDGQGTNILSNLSRAQFSLGSSAPSPPPTPVADIPIESFGVLGVPQVSSPTHPDSNKWYNNKNAEFTWLLPSGTTGTRLLIGKISNAIPTVTYVPPIRSRQIDDLDDGVWYFHTQLRNAQGWSPAFHFKLQVDTEKPEPFSIDFIDGETSDNPRPTVIFESRDDLSGISYYRVKIGEGDFFTLSSDEVIQSNPYTLPLQSPGTRTLLVQAYDKAGNSVSTSKDFTILSISSPQITEYPQSLQGGETLTVKGIADRDSQVTIWLQKKRLEAVSYSVTPNDNGGFIFVLGEGLKGGDYSLWAEAVDNRGARSNPTDKLSINVKGQSLFDLGSVLVKYLTIIVPLISLIVVLVLLVQIGWRRFLRLQEQLQQETRLIERKLARGLDSTKEKFHKQLRLLKKLEAKRKLTKNEKEIERYLNEGLDKIERVIQKERRDISNPDKL